MSALIEAAREIASLRAALKWYADGEHFTKSQPDAWDTVSGEPVNWWCDEAGTAMIEDGSLAGMVLAGKLSGEQLGALEDGEVAAAEAQPVGEPFGYVITNNVPESSPYRHVFYRPSEISAAYKDNALYSTPVYTAPPEWLSRFHHLMKKHGLHPGRTDDDLLDILDAHLSAAPPAQPAAQPLTDEQISALVLETVYENDERIPYRDYWVREIGMPFARAIEAAHGIGSQP